MHIELPNITREWTDKVLQLAAAEFENIALQTFLYQYQNNKLYGQYANEVGKSPKNVKSLTDIPFLPIRFFKTHQVTCTAFIPEAMFESSGTTNSINSRHYIKDIALYRQGFTKTFEQFYGKVSDYCVIGLLPSYLERQNSSLVVMVDELISKSNHPDSGFYLYDHEKLYAVLQKAEQQQQKTLLIGVTFALLDFAEKYSLQLHHTIIMETGGMKGRREEWTRQQVHHFLQQKVGATTIHSEYGMTELLSQAYSTGSGIFHCPNYMKVLIRQDDDPFQVSDSGDGILNVIDLVNIFSCAFIATDDIGKKYPDGSFEVAGRLDASDLRGCSLMAL